MTPPITARHVRIVGTVQGVGYRAWAARTAQVLGIAGWVRNRKDGSVEAHFEGSFAAVGEMISRCHDGPRAAIVTSVAAADAPIECAADFEIRPAA